MNKEFSREQLINDKTENEKEQDLIRNIILARRELKIVNQNFDYANEELIDFYSYQIKATQAKLNYLIKMAKLKGIHVDMINDMKFSNIIDEAV